MGLTGRISSLGGRLRTALAGLKRCCCAGCTCNPTAIPSAITINKNTIDLDVGCFGGSGGDPSCAYGGSPDEIVASQVAPDVCIYVTEVECWDGIAFYIYVMWDQPLCRWVGVISSRFENFPCSGTSTNRTNPSGTYTPTEGCPFGSFVVLP